MKILPFFLLVAVSYALIDLGTLHFIQCFSQVHVEMLLFCFHLLLLKTLGNE